LEFEKIRFLETGNHSGAWNMALDEILIDSVNRNPILRVYGWNPTCVSLGYFQSINEVNLEKCTEQKVDVVRRMTGGGAVFHEFELTYSFLTKKYPQNILESYKLICNLIIESLKKIEIQAQFAPLNDIIVHGKKICGNAQTRKKNILLQHGTILLKVDVEKMFSLLNVSPEKIDDKKISDIKQRVAGINKKFDEVSRSLKQTASEIFHADLYDDKLTKNEIDLSENLAREKYSSQKWNFRR